MADFVLVAVILGFTAFCVAYISWCDRIIGPDNAGVDSVTAEETSTLLSGSDPVTS